MAPARRLRSFLARVFRYLADAVQPGTGAPVAVAEPLPAAAAGNEHWFAVVRERAPELLTGGGIHAGGVHAGVPPRRPSALNIAAPQPVAPALPPPDLDDEPPQNSHRPVPQFTAAVRRLRRRLRLIRRRPVKGPPSVRTTTPVADHRPADHPNDPEPSGPAARTWPAVGFDTSRTRVLGNQYVSEVEQRPNAAPRPTVHWPVTPAPSVAAPAFEDHGSPTRQQWPSFERAAPASGEQPEFPLPEERAAGSVWLDERGDDDRWPELPDDEMLWEPAVSTFSSHDVTRLDDEQRGR